jgi:gliding motility-associated lipoprotein GldB
MHLVRRYLKYLTMKQFIYALSLGLILISCSNNSLKVNVSDVNVDLEIKHFDQDLLNVKPEQMEALIPGLKTYYGEFFDIFTYQMIGIGGVENPQFIEMLNAFVSDTLVQSLKIDAGEKIDTSELRENLHIAFKYYKYHFSAKKIPTIVTCISGFNHSIVTSENLVGISLDKYLGQKSAYYERLALPVYKRKNMHPEKIVPDIMYAWAVTEWPKNESNNTLLSQMIHEGKLMYFVDAMLPEMHDSLKIGYSVKQLDFCKQEESKMWTFLAEHKLLFSTDRMSIKRFIDDGPYTASFSDQSPARTGTWIGWQIVRSYMKKHPEMKLSELMDNNDAQGLLSQSGYQP